MFYLKSEEKQEDGSTKIVVKIYSACCKSDITFIEYPDGTFYDVTHMREAWEGQISSIQHARKNNIRWPY